MSKLIALFHNFRRLVRGWRNQKKVQYQEHVSGDHPWLHRYGRGATADNTLNKTL